MSDKDRSNKLLVIIAGPTASGKTETAIELAKLYHSEIISADSRQVYKELNIGVGKPRPDQLLAVPHHLLSHQNINDHYSAGHYTIDALNIINNLFEKHDILFLTGGTGLYIKAIMEGFDPMPEIPAEVTELWTKVWEQQGVQPLIEALSNMDPDYLAIVDKENYSRLIRAVSVSEYSGKPFSSFRKGEKSDRYFNFLPIVLNLTRGELYDRINQRVIEMIQNGWLEEAQQLYQYRHLKALQTVGYQELFDVIDGKLTMEEAIPQIQQATRRYAKRQLTWFRNQGDWHWVHPDNVDEIRKLIGALIG